MKNENIYMSSPQSVLILSFTGILLNIWTTDIFFFQVDEGMLLF